MGASAHTHTASPHYMTSEWLRAHILRAGMQQATAAGRRGGRQGDVGCDRPASPPALPLLAPSAQSPPCLTAKSGPGRGMSGAQLRLYRATGAKCMSPLALTRMPRPLPLAVAGALAAGGGAWGCVSDRESACVEPSHSPGRKPRERKKAAADSFLMLTSVTTLATLCGCGRGWVGGGRWVGGTVGGGADGPLPAWLAGWPIILWPLCP